MGNFKLESARLVIPPQPHTSEHNGDTIYWSGMVRSVRDIVSRAYPVWTMHGYVAVTVEDSELRLLWVDEGTKATLVPTSTGRALFQLEPVTQEEVIAAQDRWQRFRGLLGRNDPRDPLRHMGWRVWAQGEGTYTLTKTYLKFTVSGKYGMT